MIQNSSEISHSSAVLYDVLSCLILSSESSVEIASIPRSSVRIALIVSMYHTAKSGSQRLLVVLRATCCSALNEASPIKSDEAL